MKTKFVSIFLAVMALGAAKLRAQRYTVLHHFTNRDPDGQNPLAGLVLSGSTLYGTTFLGGTGDYNGGTVFKVNTDGPDGEMFEDVLLVRRGLAMTDFDLFHARQRKKSQAACPAKSINPPCLSDLSAWKSAP